MRTGQLVTRAASLRDKLLPEAAALFDPEYGGGEGAREGPTGAVGRLLCTRNRPAHCTRRTFR